MSIFFDLNKFNFLGKSSSSNSVNIPVNSNSSGINGNDSNKELILQAPQARDIKFFNESSVILPRTGLSPSLLINQENTNRILDSSIILSPMLAQTKPIIKRNKVKKKVTFPEDEKIIKDYSQPPKRGWIPGSYSTSDLLESYIKSCDRHKTKPLAKLIPHLKALQDLDCTNGEKVNVLNLKNERLDSKQMEALEEIFKRLSFKTIDLDSSTFDDETTASTLFDILDYYDTCEKLILANARTIHLFGWQSLSKFIRKSNTLEYLDLRGHTFQEFICFTYIARSLRLTTCLRVVRLENSNIQGRLLLMLAAALRDNEQIREIYLGDNKIQASDGHSIANIVKENKFLELLDLRNNNLQDLGLSHICSGLSEQGNTTCGLRSLIISNNNLTSNGISYLSKALIHNRSITTLNISNNVLTNMAIFELKDSLIVNKQIDTLILSKIKITDEGIIALAEYIAETKSLKRLDLRENDIRLGGLMALASSIKFNQTVNRIDLDQKELKRDYYIKDSIETARRLIQDINDFCSRNKRLQNEREAELIEQARLEEIERKRVEIENEKKLEELINEINTQLAADNSDPTSEDTSKVKGTLSNDSSLELDDEEPNSSKENLEDDASKYNKNSELGLLVDKEDGFEYGNKNFDDGVFNIEEVDDVEDVAENDELLKKILGRHHHVDNLSSPTNDDLLNNFFSMVDDVDGSLHIICNRAHMSKNKHSNHVNDDLKEDADKNNSQIESNSSQPKSDEIINKENENNADISLNQNENCFLQSEITDLLDSLIKSVLDEMNKDNIDDTNVLHDQKDSISNSISCGKDNPVKIEQELNQSDKLNENTESIIETSFTIENESAKLIESPPEGIFCHQPAQMNGSLNENDMNCSSTCEDEDDSDIEVIAVNKGASNNNIAMPIIVESKEILSNKNENNDLLNNTEIDNNDPDESIIEIEQTKDVKTKNSAIFSTQLQSTPKLIKPLSKPYQPQQILGNRFGITSLVDYSFNSNDDSFFNSNDLTGDEMKSPLFTNIELQDQTPNDSYESNEEKIATNEESSNEKADESSILLTSSPISTQCEIIKDKNTEVNNSLNQNKGDLQNLENNVIPSSEFSIDSDIEREVDNEIILNQVALNLKTSETLATDSDCFHLPSLIQEQFKNQIVVLNENHNIKEIPENEELKTKNCIIEPVTDNPPFFNSKLTNSQLSEELSNEIGL